MIAQWQPLHQFCVTAHENGSANRSVGRYICNMSFFVWCIRKWIKNNWSHTFVHGRIIEVSCWLSTCFRPPSVSLFSKELERLMYGLIIRVRIRKRYHIQHAIRLQAGTFSINCPYINVINWSKCNAKGSLQIRVQWVPRSATASTISYIATVSALPGYWPFVRGTTGHRLIPLTKGQKRRLWCFLWC